MKNRIIYTLLTLMFCAQLSTAQELRRKGMLGIMMQSVNDSISQQLGLADNSGLYLSMVSPNSTFDKLGASAGDVLTKLNGLAVNTPQDVLRITSNLYEGTEIEATFLSNKTEKTTHAPLQGRPIEVFENAHVQYGTVNYTGNKLRSILVSPEGIKNPPVVYFLQGYTCGSVETVSDDNPMKKLIYDWLSAGFAVYRVEKPGVGDSQSIKSCGLISFDEELEAFQEGYKELIANKAIDKENIFLFGHSMGGVIAPLLEDIYVPKGTMVFGSISKNWFDYMHDLYTIQPKHFGVSDAQIREDNQVNLKFNEDFLVKKLSAKELMANEAYVNFFRNGQLDFVNNSYIGRHFDFWQTLADVNIPAAWSQVETNVLALHGEFDIQAINKQGVEDIARIVNENKGKAKAIVIPKADHGFVNFNSLQHNVSTLNSGTYMQHARDNYSHALGEETSKWMLSILNGSK